MMKLCFAASCGGHLEELSRLAGIIGERESFLVTEESGSNVLSFCDRVYRVPLLNRREPLFPIRLLALFARALRILLREKPGCVITTGALAGFPIALTAKLLGAKVVYVESFARVSSASLTGRLIYPFADLFIVQWEEMLHKYPKAVYVGWLI